MKYKYFENEGEERSDWIENAKSTVEMVWNTESKPSHFNTTGNDHIILPVAFTSPSFARTTTTSTNNQSEGLPHLGDLPDWKKKERRKLIEDDRDELQRYLERETEDDLPSGPLQYLIDHIDDIRHNGLVKMALDIFTIPAMSADPERLFSRYGNSLKVRSTNLRTSLLRLTA